MPPPSYATDACLDPTDLAIKPTGSNVHLVGNNLHFDAHLPCCCWQVAGTFLVRPHGPYRNLKDMWDEEEPVGATGAPSKL